MYCVCRYGDDEDFSEGEDLIKAFWSEDEGGCGRTGWGAIAQGSGSSVAHPALSGDDDYLIAG